MNHYKISIRVIYADTDAMGIVYHTNYIKWFEMGRTELLRSMGLSPASDGMSSCFFPVSKVFCHYLLPARYDDILILETNIAGMKRASLLFEYRMYDEKKQRLLVRGSTLHACTNERGVVVRIPETVKAMINTREGEKR